MFACKRCGCHFDPEYGRVGIYVDTGGATTAHKLIGQRVYNLCPSCGELLRQWMSPAGPALEPLPHFFPPEPEREPPPKPQPPVSTCAREDQPGLTPLG